MSQDAPRTLLFTLKGPPEDEGLVRAGDFMTFLEGVIGALRAIERGATRQKRAMLEYRITQLEIGSATIGFEPVVEGDAETLPAFVVTRFAQAFAAVRDGVADRASFDAGAFEALNKMVAPLKRGVRSITAQIDGTEISLHAGTNGKGFRLDAPVEGASLGSYAGFLDALNVHRTEVFYLYPPVGPSRVPCEFNMSLIDEVRDSLRQYVTVHGLIEYTKQSAFPARIVVDRIEINPLSKEAVRISDLWGIAPNLAGGVDSVSFVRSLRDAEE
jgi:hypothetical protein